jgi:hypothetical protein
LYSALVFWIISVRPNSFGQFEFSVSIAVLVSLLGGYAILTNRRLLVQAAMVVLFALMIAQIIIEHIAQSLRALMPIFLAQFVSYLALIRLVDLVAQQSTVVGAIKRLDVAGKPKQPIYGLTARYLRFNLSVLALATASAYLLSLIVLTASYTVGGSLFAPYDVGLYIIALVVALLAILTQAPRE